MVHYLAWLSLVAWAVLAGACVALYLDARGARLALSAISGRVRDQESALAALAISVKDQDLATVAAVARVARLGAGLSTIEACHHRKIVMLNDSVRQLDQEVGALNRIVAHVDEATLAALPSLVRNAWHAAHGRRNPPDGKPTPPLDIEGDPHLDAPAPAEGFVDCCLARLEEQGLVPPPGMDAQTFDALVDLRYGELIGSSNAARAPARHCEAVERCAMEEGGDGRARVAACCCDCAPCGRARDLLVKAYREISGREPLPRARLN